jgi:serine/threonine-protein kinase RsbT
MTELDDVIRALDPYLSQPNARALLHKALRQQNLSPEGFTLGDLTRILPHLERGLFLFLGKLEGQRALRDLAKLGNGEFKSVQPCSVRIDSEADISTARANARRICTEMGATSLTTQKVTTIVSELARNIVSYTKGGSVDVTPGFNRERKITVRATDSGPGIPHLSVVMSGSYQSKTGLGKGLFGTRRLADHFDITTGPAGTTIVAEVRV